MTEATLQRLSVNKRDLRVGLDEKNFDRLVVLLFDVGWIDVGSMENPWVH